MIISYVVLLLCQPMNVRNLSGCAYKFSCRNLVPVIHCLFSLVVIPSHVPNCYSTFLSLNVFFVLLGFPLSSYSPNVNISAPLTLLKIMPTGHFRMSPASFDQSRVLSCYRLFLSITLLIWKSFMSRLDSTLFLSCINISGGKRGFVG